MIKRYFPAKILLFGEFTAIHGGDILAIPFEKFGAYWDFDSDQDNVELKKYFAYLEKELHDDFELNTFENDLQNGLVLRSTIPFGYGAGSSGSVVAAVYDQYYRHEKSDDPSDLLSMFSKMESYFHGSSSGIDPLVSYLGEAIYRCNGVFSKLNIDDNLLLKNIYIWDSNYSRSTENFVNWFKTELENTAFEKRITNDLLPINNAMIKIFLTEEKEVFDSLFESFMCIQQELLAYMYPENMIQKMKLDFEDEDIKYKLCGAGGGGFFIVLKDQLKQHLLNSVKSIYPLG